MDINAVDACQRANADRRAGTAPSRGRDPPCQTAARAACSLPRTTYNPVAPYTASNNTLQTTAGLIERLLSGLETFRPVRRRLFERLALEGAGADFPTSASVLLTASSCATPSVSSLNNRLPEESTSVVLSDSTRLYVARVRWNS